MKMTVRGHRLSEPVISTEITQQSLQHIQKSQVDCSAVDIMPNQLCMLKE